MKINHDAEAEDVSILCMENLLWGLETATFLDAKLGTSTLTKRAATLGKAEARAKKDAKRTHKDLGFSLTGYCIKDKDGATVEKKVKFDDEVTKDNIDDYLTKLFSHEDKVNSKAVEFVCAEIE